VLYRSSTCGWCRRVERLIGALEIDVEYRDRGQPEFRAELVSATGSSQVPCLFIDGTPLLESAAIIDWLERYQAAIPEA
jgi:glutaredoxin